LYVLSMSMFLPFRRNKNPDFSKDDDFSSEPYYLETSPIRQKENKMLTVKSKINITAHPKFYRGAKRAYIGSERIAGSSRPVIAIVSRASMSFIQDHPESEANG